MDSKTRLIKTDTLTSRRLGMASILLKLLSSDIAADMEADQKSSLLLCQQRSAIASCRARCGQLTAYFARSAPPLRGQSHTRLIPDQVLGAHFCSGRDFLLALAPAGVNGLLGPSCQSPPAGLMKCTSAVLVGIALPPPCALKSCGLAPMRTLPVKMPPGV
jgi:hypothetical protein